MNYFNYKVFFFGLDEEEEEIYLIIWNKFLCLIFFLLIDIFFASTFDIN